MEQTQNTKRKDVLITELPYEKFERLGAEALSDAELLAILLRTGTKGEDTVSIGQKILNLSGAGADGLLGLYHLSLEQLTALHGVGPVKAIRIKCVAELSRRLARLRLAKTLHFTDPKAVAAYYMETLRHAETEQVMLLLLDGHCGLLRELVLTKGTVNASLLSPREVFLEALKCRAVYVMLLHNHPSGDATPSSEDLSITMRIKESGEMLGIPLLDHIIIGDMTYTSMKQDGLFQ